MYWYEIRYKFLDELKDKDMTWRSGNVIVYDTAQKGLGETFSKTLDDANFDDAFKKVDKMLSDNFDGLKDEDVVFYLDWDDLPPEDGRDAAALVVGLQREFGIMVDEIDFIEEA